MKKKTFNLFILISAFIVVFALVITFSVMASKNKNSSDAHEHTWKSPTYEWSKDYLSCKAVRTCIDDQLHNEEEVASSTYSVITSAKCEEDGLGRYIVTFKNSSFDAQTHDVVIEATGHNWNVPTYEWNDDFSQCTATRICQNDNSHIETETVNSTYSVITSAKCEEDGLGRYIVIFKNSSFDAQTHDVVIEATGHNWNVPTYEWNDDFSQCTATRICQNDNSHIETETVNSTYSVITSAECEEDGLGRYIVTFKNSSFEAQTYDVVIETTGHNWNVPTYEWNDDFSQCTATRICQNDNSHIETETVNSTYSVITYSSIDEKCVEKYNATFTKKAFETQIKNITLEYSRIGNKIYFGSYPQTLVEDDSLIASLNTNAGELPTATDLKAWTDYNYYSASKVESYMYYQDIDYDNDGDYDYRGVYFTHYRPFHYHSDGLSKDDTYQGDNGYEPNTIYWFKFEPIEWNILNESNGKALIIANLVLDSQDYYPNVSSSMIEHNGGMGYVNNYELSNIRKFINGNFYNDAFNDLEKLIIEITEVDNSASSTDDDLNEYACNNTNDKMFLLSYKEATTYYKTNYSRKTQGTDYAKCQGLNNYYYFFYDGVDAWWLRSPYSNNPEEAYYIYDDSTPSTNSFRPDYGVRPVCWLKLTNN